MKLHASTIKSGQKILMQDPVGILSNTALELLIHANMAYNPDTGSILDMKPTLISESLVICSNSKSVSVYFCLQYVTLFFEFCYS